MNKVYNISIFHICNCMKEKPTCEYSMYLGVRRRIDTSQTIMCLEKNVKELVKNEKSM